ncbi:hypothetical protein F5Y13DRAFT_8538 [Hypoxylon sp. FL1857]|nr:hypothetical protein F5Y13DRAFT_8538 [Hypoxylon sp. FL1857]
MIRNPVLLLLCLSSFRQWTEALQVTPGSSCAAICLDNPEGDVQDPNASTTKPTDIVCNDQEYSTTAGGIKFKNCIECLQESHAMSNAENDMSWYLYNLRYSVDVCLYGFPNATKDISSPCDIDYACRPLKQALETELLTPGNGTKLNYCTADSGAFSGSQLQDCVQCFRSSSNQFYMSNFLTALQAGCQQKPQPGDLLGLSGSLFTQFQVNITAAAQNQTDASNDNPSDTSHTSMTPGAIVGIAVGAVLLFLGSAGLFWVYHRKQKYFYGNTLDSQDGPKSITPPLVGSYPPYPGNGNISLPTDWELQTQKPYTNNAQYYERMEKAIEANQQPNYTYHPGQPNLPTHPAYIPRVASRTASRNDTPSPPPIKSNRPDTFAINAYLNAAAAPPTNPTIVAPTANAMTVGRNTLPPLPPPQFQAPPQPQTYLQPQPFQLAAPPAATLLPLAPPPSHGPTTHPIFAGGAPPPPPPPPPPAQRTPRLSLPTKNRKPTKYVPPQITVDRPSEDVTPPRSSDDDRDEVLSIGFEILSPPMARNERQGPRWEQESSAGYGVRTGTPPEQYHYQQPQFTQKHTVDRRRRVTEFTDIGSVHSANSEMYG